MGPSYEAIVRLRLKCEKCSKAVWEAKPRAEDILRTPHGGKEDRKGVRIGSVGEEKKSLAWERGRTRLIGRCRVPRNTGSVMVETKSWSGCADW